MGSLYQLGLWRKKTFSIGYFPSVRFQHNQLNPLLQGISLTVHQACSFLPLAACTQPEGSATHTWITGWERRPRRRGFCVKWFRFCKQCHQLFRSLKQGFLGRFVLDGSSNQLKWKQKLIFKWILKICNVWSDVLKAWSFYCGHTFIESPLPHNSTEQLSHTWLTWRGCWDLSVTTKQDTDRSLLGQMVRILPS